MTPFNEQGELVEQLVLAEEPHHDGSPRYTPAPPQALGESFDVWLRVPDAAGISRVVAREVHDGEPFAAAAYPERREPGATWWRARLTQANPVVNYRFLTDGGPNGYRWITAAGPADHDPTDAGDYVSSIHPGGPSWLTDSVAYQVFPDRFARSERVPEAVRDSAAWAQPAEWADEPILTLPGRPRQFYGGDLWGVLEHLDDLAALGVDLLYLTPFFPAPSNHRYNASSFDYVDPLLGGDEALAALVGAAHARGMRVIGDFTANHTGNSHDWFRAAQADQSVAEAGFYYFGESADDYVGWFGVRSMPKVNHGDAGLRSRLVTGSDSPVRRFLRPPFELDGWRIDVGNMAGRNGAADLNAEVAADFRTAIAAERADAYLVAENFHDFRADFRGPGWHGVMNYSGFAKPLWQWLGDGSLEIDHWLGMPWPGWPQLPGAAAVATMRAFTAVPWANLCSSLTLIDSHDTPRIRTITGGDPALRRVALGAMVSYPGVPMIFAGDEVGLEGTTGEDSRRTIPWDDEAVWDAEARADYREFIALRRGVAALRHGSLRWAFVDADRLAFLRETDDEVVLVLLARAPGPPIRLASSAIGMQETGQCESLYGDVAVGFDDGAVVLPGSGPAVCLWRWPANRLEPINGG